MIVRVRRCGSPLSSADLARVATLYELCMPGDKLYPADLAQWWLAHAERDAIGYAAARVYEHLDGVFFVAAGVLPLWRGVGLHGRMIRARLRWARARGLGRAVTYTLLRNVASANALIRAGFRRSDRWDYVGGGVDYWECRL